MPYDAMNEQTDEQLLAAYANGDASAARALTARLTPPVFAHAYRMLGGDRAEAEDVVQEALLRLWRVAPQWRAGDARVTTWLYRITANLCIDRLRRSQRRRGPDLDSLPDPEDPAPDAAEQMQNEARAAALQTALMALPDRQRQAVILRHIEGLSNPEIAQIMDIGTRAVESLTARGKRALEAQLINRKAELGYGTDDGT